MEVLSTGKALIAYVLGMNYGIFSTIYTKNLLTPPALSCRSKDTPLTNTTCLLVGLQTWREDRE